MDNAKTQLHVKNVVKDSLAKTEPAYQDVITDSTYKTVNANNVVKMLLLARMLKLQSHAPKDTS